MAFYQQADFVIGRKVHRTDHAITPALTQPSLGGIGQRACRLRVILALEPSEQAPLVSLEAVEALIDMGADPTDRPPVEVSEEVLSLGVLEEGVLLAIEPFLHIHQQWSDPVAAHRDRAATGA